MAAGYFVTPQGFFEKKHQLVTIDDLKEYNPFRSHLFEKLEQYKYFNIKARYEMIYKNL
jgi:hypothetical protein